MLVAVAVCLAVGLTWRRVQAAGEASALAPDTNVFAELAPEFEDTNAVPEPVQEIVQDGAAPEVAPDATDTNTATVFEAPGVTEALADDMRAQYGRLADISRSTAPVDVSDEVTVYVQNGSIVDVLNAFSMQTGKNVVVGPDVSENVTLRLNQTPWEDALEVILKPYGYGHKIVGDTIVVSKLEKLMEVESIEPLVSKVFQLKYLDALGVKEMIEAQLSTRGNVTTITIRGQRGWGFAKTQKGGGSGSQAATDGGKRERRALDDRQVEEEKLRSKTIVVTDIPSVIDSVEQLLKDVDRMPRQVLIESRFCEVSSDDLKDVGVQFNTGANNVTAEPIAFTGGGSWFGLGAAQLGGDVGPAAFKTESKHLNAAAPYNAAGMGILFQKLNDVQLEVFLHMLQEVGSLNVLSAPRIMTLNNQEASIIVGKKFPIIKSDVSGISGTASTSVDYWQDIGIQLNVVPQICDDDFVRMVIHPAVTEQIGVASAETETGGSARGTEYPILSTRETETQIVIKSGETVVIGGLMTDTEQTTQLKVPYLGDLPYVGRFFRRDTGRKEKMDLLIFLTGTIMSIENVTQGVMPPTVMKWAPRIEEDE